MTGTSHTDDDTAARRARLFWDGSDQAVQLPMEFVFDGEEVTIRREGKAVILEPVRRRIWPAGYWAWIKAHRDDLELGALEPDGGENVAGHG